MFCLGKFGMVPTLVKIQTMSKWQEWKDSLGDARPWHLFDPEKQIENKEIIEQRMSICMSCEYFLKPTQQCKKCGCFMPFKTKLKGAGCPIGKWSIEN